MSRVNKKYARTHIRTKSDFQFQLVNLTLNKDLNKTMMKLQLEKRILKSMYARVSVGVAC